MRSRAVVIIVVLSLLWAGAAVSASPRSAPARVAKEAPRRVGEKDGWPDTKAGAIARRWTEAFSKGEKAMRECLAEIVSPTDLARRSIDQRIEKYRDLHDRLGSLMLVKVDSSSVGRVVATLAASDFAKREFIFNVQTEPPYKLASVMIRETIRQGGHGGFHH